MSDDTEIDQAIEAYRAELMAEAELARGDLEEIEDHMRALIDQLRASGAIDAIAEARQRLGDPKAIAREHARVRGAFGARLSRTRAWSAAVLMIPILWMYAGSTVAHTGLVSRWGLQLSVGVVLVTALIARLSWARALLLAGLTFYLVLAGFDSCVGSRSPIDLVLSVGAIGFLAPWRRDEISGAGAALALQVWAYSAASFALIFQYSSPDRMIVPVAGAAQIAFVAAIVATAGAMLRARWSAIAATVSAATLIVALTELWGLHCRLPHPDVRRIEILSLVASGAIAAGAGMILSWRTARTTLGTLRSLVS
jgi:plasmid stabilization system protein ParE